MKNPLNKGGGEAVPVEFDGIIIKENVILKAYLISVYDVEDVNQ